MHAHEQALPHVHIDFWTTLHCGSIGRIYKYGFAFYDNEEGSIANRIKKIKTEKPEVPKELIEYYRNVFFII